MRASGASTTTAASSLVTKPVRAPQPVRTKTIKQTQRMEQSLPCSRDEIS